MLPLADECYKKSRQMSHNKNKIYASVVQHSFSFFSCLFLILLKKSFSSSFFFVKLLRSDSRLDLSFFPTLLNSSSYFSHFHPWNNERSIKKKYLKQSEKEMHEMNWDHVLVTYKALCRTEIQYHVKQKTARK